MLLKLTVFPFRSKYSAGGEREEAQGGGGGAFVYGVSWLSYCLLFQGFEKVNASTFERVCVYV